MPRLYDPRTHHAVEIGDDPNGPARARILLADGWIVLPDEGADAAPVVPDEGADGVDNPPGKKARGK